METRLAVPRETLRHKFRQTSAHIRGAIRPCHAGAHLGRAAKISAVPGQMLAHGDKSRTAASRSKCSQCSMITRNRSSMSMAVASRFKFVSPTQRSFHCGLCPEHPRIALGALPINTPSTRFRGRAVHVPQISHIAVTQNQGPGSFGNFDGARDGVPVRFAFVALRESAAMQ